MKIEEPGAAEPQQQPDGALFRDFCELCENLSATTGRKDRTAAVASYLASLSAAEAEAAARLLVGRILAEREGRVLAVGGRTVLEVVKRLGGADGGEVAAGADFGESVARGLPESPDGKPLLLLEVVADLRAVAALGGDGSRRRRLDELMRLFARASRLEAKYLARIAVDDMRHGVREGTVIEGIAAMSGMAPADIRRAQQTLGDVGAVARQARRDPAALAESNAQLFRPLKPMLAQSAAGPGEAFDELGGDLAMEWKLDGARVQIHTRDDEVRIFTRRLNEVTHSLPEIVAQMRERRADEAIFEGEVLAVRDGRPLPFQELMRRFRRKREVERMIEVVPVELHLFDILHRDGVSLLDEGTGERWRELGEACGTLQRVAHIEPSTRQDAVDFYRAAVAAGHEGVVAKSLTGPYAPGARGRHWLKVKRVHTVDLAVIAAEWGYGRRKGWLSNYHLAARDTDGRLLMVGKTFKGPTDAVFRQMTETLLGLETSRDRSTVYVRPQIVAEVKFEGVQASDLYESGIALRFARIVRFRDDKPISEIDTLESLRAV